MKKAIYILLLPVIISCGRTVTVYNYSDLDRKAETVELALEGNGFVVTDCEGREIPSQITYDGKLIFQADVLANSKSVYHIREGKPQRYDTVATGAVYPERLDDLAWESDLAAYRIYGPKLQQTGEKAFGNDVWVKNNTGMPVVADRYRLELEDGVSYHQDHGNGYDGYNVGPTLGAGRTAILADSTVIYPYCYEQCKILDNGPIRFTVEVTYGPNEMSVTEKRIISIDAGNFLNHETVLYSGPDKKLITGIVLHGSDPGANFVDPDSTFISHLERVGNDEIYIAALFTKPFESADTAYGHLAAYNTGSLDYFWGASWNRATGQPMPDFDAWNLYLKQFYAKLNSPLAIR